MMSKYSDESYITVINSNFDATWLSIYFYGPWPYGYDGGEYNQMALRWTPWYPDKLSGKSVTVSYKVRCNENNKDYSGTFTYTYD